MCDVSLWVLLQKFRNKQRIDGFKAQPHSRENPYWNILHAMNLNDARLKSFFSVPTIV